MPDDLTKLSNDQLFSVAGSDPSIRRDLAMGYFQDKGWQPHQAAGIIGNLWHESSGKTEALGDKGASYGIGQWQGPRRTALENFAKGSGSSPDDFYTQLEFIQHELGGSEKSAGDALRNTATVDQATRIFSEKYERPGKPMMKSRLKLAAEVLGWPAEAGAAEQSGIDISGMSNEELAKIAGISLPKAEKTDKPAGLCKGTNCGDMVANTLNPKLEAAGLPTLEQGGLAINSPAKMAEETGSKLYRHKDTPFTADTLAKMPDNTFMVAGSGGDDSHAQVIGTNEKGERGVISWNKDRGTYWETFEDAARKIEKGKWDNWTATAPLEGRESLAGKIAAGTDVSSMSNEDLARLAGISLPKPVREGVIKTGAKLGLVDIAGAANILIDPKIALAAAGDYQGVNDYVWQHPTLNMFSVKDRQMLSEEATKNLIKEMWPNGMPPEPGLIGGFVRDTVRMWPLFMAMTALQPLVAAPIMNAITGGTAGATVGHAGNIIASNVLGRAAAQAIGGASALGLYGAATVDPYHEVPGLAAFGAGGGALHGITSTLPLFTKIISRMAGGSSLFGGIRALGGGTWEEIKRDAVFGLVLETAGVPFAIREHVVKNTPVEIKDQFKDIASRAEEVNRQYSRTPSPDLVFNKVYEMMSSLKSGESVPFLENMLPQKVVNDIRSGAPIDPEYTAKILTRTADAYGTDYPTQVVPGRVEVKGKKGKITEKAGFVEEFPEEEKLTPAKLEQIVQAAARERQLEIDKLQTEGGRITTPIESEGEAQIRQINEARAAEEIRIAQLQERLDTLRNQYERDVISGWNMLTPEEVNAEIDEMLSRYRSGSKEPIIEAALPADVVEGVKKGWGLSPFYVDRIKNALYDDRMVQAAPAQFEQYLRSQQNKIDAVAQQARMVEEAEVAPMFRGQVAEKEVSQAREEVSKRYDISPENLEYKGVMKGGKDHDLALFEVTDPEHPRYKSTLSSKIAKVDTTSLRGAKEGTYEKIELPRTGKAEVAAPEIGRTPVRNEYRPENDLNTSGRLRDIKSGIAESVEKAEWEVLRGIEDVGVIEPPNADILRTRAKALGVDEVLWVKTDQFSAYTGVNKGKPYILMAEDIGGFDRGKLLDHELGDHLRRSRHPGVLELINMVNRNSPKFREFKSAYERPFKDTGMKFSDHTIAGELVSDMFAGIDEVADLHHAFTNPTSALLRLEGVKRSVVEGWQPKIVREPVDISNPPMFRSKTTEEMEALKGKKPGPGRPSIPFANAFKKVLDETRRILSPETRSEEAMRTAEGYTEQMTLARAEVLRAARMLMDYRTEWLKLPEADRWALSAKMERGEKLPAEWQPYAQARKEAFDKVWNAVSSTREGSVGYIKNFAPHLYADSEKAKAFFDTIGKRPLEGKKGFLHRRVIPDMETAIKEHGLLPLFDNPMQQDLAGLMEQWKYVAANRFVDYMVKNDLFLRVNKNGVPIDKNNKPVAVPEGWVKTDPRVFKQGYAPEHSMQVIHNHLISEAGNLAYQQYKNVMSFWNAMHVTFSLFHGVNTLANQMAMGFAKGIPEFIGAAMSGDTAKMALSMKRVGPMAVVDAARWNREGSQEFHKPGATNPRVATVVDYATRGGILPESLMAMSGQAAENLTELGTLMKQGELGKAARSAIHLLGKPIMGYLVPTVKYGSTLARIAREYDTLKERYDKQYGKNWSPEAEAAFHSDMMKIAYNERQFSDNIFGEIHPDNLHWNRGFSKMLKGIIAYPGWNTGTTRWLVGMLRGVGEMATGKPMDYQARMSVQFGLGLMVTVGIANTILHMLMNNGEAPDDWRDVLIGGRTGKYLSNGAPERITIASYMKEIIAAAKDIQTGRPEMITSKLQAPFTMLKELYDNADFYGTEIVPSKGTAFEKATALGKWFGGKALPFGASNIYTAKSPVAQYGGLVGLRTLPRYTVSTDAMNRIDEIMRASSPKLRSPEAAGRSRKVSELKDLGWEGKREEMEAGIREARQAGDITDIQAQHIRQTVMKDKRVAQFDKLMQMEDAIDVYERGTPEEKRLWRPRLAAKWSRTSPEKQRRLREEYHKVMAMPVAEEMPERIPPRFSILNQ